MENSTDEAKLDQENNDPNKEQNINEEIPSTDKIQPLIQDTPWKDVKIAMSKNITGKTHDIRNVMQKYGKATKGVLRLMRSTKTGVTAGKSLVSFLANGYNGTSVLANNIKDIFKTERDIKIALSRLADVLSPSPDDKESAVTRDAIINSLTQLYEYIELNNLDIKRLENINNDLREQVLSTYICEYIWGRLLNDLQICFEKKGINLSDVQKIEKEHKEYIQNYIEVEVRKVSHDSDFTNIDVETLFRNCYEVVIE